MNKLLNASEVLVLAKIYSHKHTSIFKGANIQEIKEYVSTVKPLATITIRRILSDLLDTGYIQLGVKTGNKLSYFITSEGCDLVEKMIREGEK